MERPGCAFHDCHADGIVLLEVPVIIGQGVLTHSVRVPLAYCAPHARDLMRASVARDIPVAGLCDWSETFERYHALTVGEPI
jgi:hypothetical protein